MNYLVKLSNPFNYPMTESIVSAALQIQMDGNTYNGRGRNRDENYEIWIDNNIYNDIDIVIGFETLNNEFITSIVEPICNRLELDIRHASYNPIREYTILDVERNLTYRRPLRYLMRPPAAAGGRKQIKRTKGTIRFPSSVFAKRTKLSINKTKQNKK